MIISNIISSELLNWLLFNNLTISILANDLRIKSSEINSSDALRLFNISKLELFYICSSDLCWDNKLLLLFLAVILSRLNDLFTIDVL